MGHFTAESVAGRFRIVAAVSFVAFSVKRSKVGRRQSGVFSCWDKIVDMTFCHTQTRVADELFAVCDASSFATVGVENSVEKLYSLFDFRFWAT